MKKRSGKGRNSSKSFVPTWADLPMYNLGWQAGQRTVDDHPNGVQLRCMLLSFSAGFTQAVLSRFGWKLYRTARYLISDPKTVTRYAGGQKLTRRDQRVFSNTEN